MDLKVLNQYSYFIYPFYIKRQKYRNFISALLNDSNWDFKILNSPEDQKTASFFLPDVRKFLFPTLLWSDDAKEDFRKLPNNKKVWKISKLAKATFEYKLSKPIKSQLQIKNDGNLKFEIEDIRIITFEQGTGLLIFKTNIEKNDLTYNNILDFNFNFREINLFHENLKDVPALIDCEGFENVSSVSALISHFLDNFRYVESDNVYYDRLFTYSYVCLDESEWNEDKPFGNLIYEFFKFKHVLPGEFYSRYNEDFMKKDDTTYSRWNYSMYGFLKESGVVLGSAKDSFSSKQLSIYFETIYFYIFMMAIYQRMLLLLLSKELVAAETPKIAELKEYLLKFTNISWFNQITNSEQGMDMWKKWQKVFELPVLFEEVQREYSEYYDHSFAQSQDKINRFLVYVFVVSVVFPGISLLVQFGLLNPHNLILRDTVIITLLISILYYPIYIVAGKLKAIK